MIRTDNDKHKWRNKRYTIKHLQITHTTSDKNHLVNGCMVLIFFIICLNFNHWTIIPEGALWGLSARILTEHLNLFTDLTEAISTDVMKEAEKSSDDRIWNVLLKNWTHCLFIQLSETGAGINTVFDLTENLSLKWWKFVTWASKSLEEVKATTCWPFGLG